MALCLALFVRATKDRLTELFASSMIQSVLVLVTIGYLGYSAAAAGKTPKCALSCP
jgi:hypothetical protein